MRTDSMLYWATLSALIALIALLLWLGHWHVAASIGVAVLAYVITPRVETALEGKGASKAPRRAWQSLRRDVLIIVACVAAALLWAGL